MAKQPTKPTSKSKKTTVTKKPIRRDGKMIFLTVFTVFSASALIVIAVFTYLLFNTGYYNDFVVDLYDRKFCSEKNFERNKKEILSGTKTSQQGNNSIERLFAWYDFAVCNGTEHPEEAAASTEQYLESIGLPLQKTN